MRIDEIKLNNRKREVFRIIISEKRDIHYMYESQSISITYIDCSFSTKNTSRMHFVWSRGDLGRLRLRCYKLSGKCLRRLVWNTLGAIVVARDSSAPAYIEPRKLTLETVFSKLMYNCVYRSHTRRYQAFFLLDEPAKFWYSGLALFNLAHTLIRISHILFGSVVVPALNGAYTKDIFVSVSKLRYEPTRDSCRWYYVHSNYFITLFKGNIFFKCMTEDGYTRDAQDCWIITNRAESFAGDQDPFMRFLCIFNVALLQRDVPW